MFPLEFPLGVLARRSAAGQVVFDPFCGRGTTLYAARDLGFETYGIDSNPVAVAISQGKLANTDSDEIMDVLDEILASTFHVEIPSGEFWSWAYDQSVLRSLCRLRACLMADCRSHARKALRAVLLGALHGPKGKSTQSYFSNQMPRTYASKPAYAVSFWKRRGDTPPKADIREIVEARAIRFFDSETQVAFGRVVCSDSRESVAITKTLNGRKLTCSITSPPYYGMRTYIPDQWLRNWFVGGPAEVDYTACSQLSHRSPDLFVGDLQKVWKNVRAASCDGALLVVRFGGLHDRECNPTVLITKSLKDTGWAVQTIKSAGTANRGRRQANSFGKTGTGPMEEVDVWCKAI